MAITVITGDSRNQDEDVSFFPIEGLLMLFLQFGQLKGPTPRGPSKATLLGVGLELRGGAEREMGWACSFQSPSGGESGTGGRGRERPAVGGCHDRG